MPRSDTRYTDRHLYIFTFARVGAGFLYCSSLGAWNVFTLCIGQIEASTCPPGNPPGIWLFWKLLFKFPPTLACARLSDSIRSRNVLKAKLRRARLGKRGGGGVSLQPPRVFRISYYWATFHHYLGAWNRLPPTRAKMLFKCPTLGSIQVIKCSHPGDISQAQKWQKDGGNTFSCRTKSLWI